MSIRNGSWPHITMMYLVGVIAFVAMGTLGPLVGDFSRAYGASVQAVGMLIGLQVCCGALIGTFIGWVIDRFGARVVMLIGGMLLIVSNVLNIMTSSLYVAGASFLLQGVGLLALVLGGQVTLSTGIPPGKRQVQALSLWSTAPFVGVAAGMLMAAPFADGEKWRYALMIEGALGAVAMLLVVIAPQARVSVEKVNPFEVFRSGRVVRLAIAFGLISLTGQGSNAVVSLYLARTHGVSVGTAASLLGLANLAGIIGSFAMGAALSRGVSPAKVVWVVAVFGIAGGLLTYAPSLGFSPAVAGMMIWTMVMGATVAFVYTLVVRITPNPAQIGAAAGLVNQGSGVGIVFAAPLFLYIYATEQWPLFVAIIFIAWVAMLLLAPVRGAVAQAPSPVAGKGALISKSIAGATLLATMAALLAPPIEAATSKVAPAALESGKVLYQEKCALCHEPGAMGALMLAKRLGGDKADLSNRKDLPAAYVRAVVRNGLKGMPYFTRVELTDDELTTLASYLTRNQRSGS